MSEVIFHLHREFNQYRLSHFCENPILIVKEYNFKDYWKSKKLRLLKTIKMLRYKNLSLQITRNIGTGIESVYTFFFLIFQSLYGCLCLSKNLVSAICILSNYLSIAWNENTVIAQFTIYLITQLSIYIIGMFICCITYVM